MEHVTRPLLSHYVHDVYNRALHVDGDDSSQTGAEVLQNRNSAETYDNSSRSKTKGFKLNVHKTNLIMR